MSTNGKNFFFGFICFIVFPIIVLVILEVGLEFLGVESLYEKKFEARSKRGFLDNHSFYLIDRELLWKLQPDTYKVVDGYLYKVNSHGMRSSEFEMKKRAGVFRIAVLGDSSTFGLNLPYEEIYHQYLLSMLREKHPGREFEVLNFGVPGYSSRQGLVVLKEWYGKIKPDLLIASFGANDGYSIPEDVYGDMEIVGTSSTLAVYFRSELERSRLITVVSILIDRLKEGGGISGEKASKGNKSRVPAEGFGANIIAMASIAKRDGVPVIFLNISIAPQYFSVIKRLSDRGEITFCDVEAPLQDAYYSRGRDEFLSKFPQKRIATPIMPEIDEMCTELLGEKQMLIRRDRLLFTDDFHPNSAGNYVIAKTLFVRIEDLKLVK